MIHYWWIQKKVTNSGPFGSTKLHEYPVFELACCDNWPEVFRLPPFRTRTPPIAWFFGLDNLKIKELSKSDRFWGKLYLGMCNVFEAVLELDWCTFICTKQSSEPLACYFNWHKLLHVLLFRTSPPPMRCFLFKNMFKPKDVIEKKDTKSIF